MKLIHIIIPVLLWGRGLAQQETAPVNLARLTDMAYRSSQRVSGSYQDAHLGSEKNRQASWYVSTDAGGLQTTILFLDSNRRVIYEELLPRQAVQLTRHNRRVLDEMLSRLTHQQLVGPRLKTLSIRTVGQPSRVPVPEFVSDLLPAGTPVLHPTGLLTRVQAISNNLLYVWWKTPEVEKVNFQIRDYQGNFLKFISVKNSQNTDTIHLDLMRSGNYEVMLYGRTWNYTYQLQIDREQNRVRLIPLVR